jgi:hypothetical protein
MASHLMNEPLRYTAIPEFRAKSDPFPTLPAASPFRFDDFDARVGFYDRPHLRFGQVGIFFRWRCWGNRGVMFLISRGAFVFDIVVRLLLSSSLVASLAMPDPRSQRIRRPSSETHTLAALVAKCAKGLNVVATRVVSQVLDTFGL